MSQNRRVPYVGYVTSPSRLLGLLGGPVEQFIEEEPEKSEPSGPCDTTGIDLECLFDRPTKIPKRKGPKRYFSSPPPRTCERGTQTEPQHHSVILSLFSLLMATAWLDSTPTTSTQEKSLSAEEIRALIREEFGQQQQQTSAKRGRGRGKRQAPGRQATNLKKARYEDDSEGLWEDRFEKLRRENEELRRKFEEGNVKEEEPVEEEEPEVPSFSHDFGGGLVNVLPEYDGEGRQKIQYKFRNTLGDVGDLEYGAELQPQYVRELQQYKKDPTKSGHYLDWLEHLNASHRHVYDRGQIIQFVPKHLGKRGQRSRQPETLHNDRQYAISLFESVKKNTPQRFAEWAHRGIILPDSRYEDGDKVLRVVGAANEATAFADYPVIKGKPPEAEKPQKPQESEETEEGDDGDEDEEEESGPVAPKVINMAIQHLIDDAKSGDLAHANHVKATAEKFWKQIDPQHQEELKWAMKQVANKLPGFKAKMNV